MKFFCFKTSIFLAVSILVHTFSFAQERGDFGLEYTYLGRETPAGVADRVQAIRVTEGSYFEIERTDRRLPGEAMAAAQVIMLPSIDGAPEAFQISRNMTMSEELQSQYPDISSGNIVSVENPSVWGKIDFTPRGMHAVIFTPGGETLFIDPLSADDAITHVMYRRRDFITEKMMECRVSEDTPGVPLSQAGAGQPYNSCELRTYRIAISATGEYTIFHGGGVDDALSAMVTTMNRVNGLYERDFGVTMTIVANNADLIFTNPDTDPFTNGTPGQMIQENQVLINAVIQSDNYDIGHVFGTNSGGLAGLGVTCNDNSKARGVTGSAAPIGDPFDIDYVAHEIGHQFGSNHCYNNACNGNRNNSTAAEPGSGSTIMAYAGICVPNVQNNSDDHFHGISMREIGLRIQSDNCAVMTNANNTSPQILSTATSMWIPASTPFELSAEATDAEGDLLTYNWEQMDIEISPQPPVASSQGGPNFRSFSPDPSPVRILPRMEVLISGAPSTWERLPGVAREMNFRLSVRDNNPFAGCNQFADVVVNVAGTEPFELIAPDAPGIVWPGLSYQEVEWNVAGTDLAPVSAETVDIYLSTTAEPNFNTLLAQAVPNTGSYFVLVPNSATTDARIKVTASNQPFFDLSSFNFTITVEEEGFYFEAASLTAEGCTGSEFEFNLSTSVLTELPGDVLLEAIDLPEGIDVLFDPPVVAPGQDFTVTVITALDAPEGTSGIQIAGSSGAVFNDIFLFTDLVNADPQPAAPAFPENQEAAASINTSLGWSANAGNGEVYAVDLALDEAFNEIVFAESDLTETSVLPGELLPETTYFWRTRNENECAASDYSETFSFTTASCNSGTGSSVDIAGVPDGPTSTQSVTSIEQSGEISGVKVTNISGAHSNTGQLFFRLTGPQGTSVDLGTAACGAEVTIRGGGSFGVQIPGQAQENFQASSPSDFGPDIGPDNVVGQAVLAIDGNGIQGAELCDPPLNPEVLSGKIAVVFRGDCQFIQKVFNAQQAGAIGVIIINDEGNGFFTPGGSPGGITIPSVMVGSEAGNILAGLLAFGSESFDFGFDDFADPNAQSNCAGGSTVLVRPVDPLAAFNGENAQGEWVLTIDNSVGLGSGFLDSWTLQVCYESLGDELSTSNEEHFGLKVFPNPTTGEVFTQWDRSAGFTDLSIADLHGTAVLRSDVRGLDRTNIDLSRFAPGIYIVHLRGPSAAAVHKLVLTR